MNTIKAVRAHNAALKHKPSADRIPLWYTVSINAGGNNRTLIAGTIQVKAQNDSRRKAEMTKLMNRLQAMYPEATHFEVSYDK